MFLFYFSGKTKPKFSSRASDIENKTTGFWEPFEFNTKSKSKLQLQFVMSYRDQNNFVKNMTSYRF